jgi:hypothetical protein
LVTSVLLNNQVRHGFDARRSHDAWPIGSKGTHQEIAEHDCGVREVSTNALRKIFALAGYTEKTVASDRPESDRRVSITGRHSAVNGKAWTDNCGMPLALGVDRRLEPGYWKGRGQQQNDRSEMGS